MKRAGRELVETPAGEIPLAAIEFFFFTNSTCFGVGAKRVVESKFPTFAKQSNGSLKDSGIFNSSEPVRKIASAESMLQ
jgi:hypothetical protein